MTRRVGKPLFALMVCLFATLGLGAPADAHELQPGYLELRLIDTDLYAVVWKTPAQAGAPMPISVRLPERCDPRTPGHPIWDGTGYVARWTTSCPGGLEGGVIVIEGLERTSTDVLVRFDFANGLSGVHRLTASDTSFTVPLQPNRVEVAGTYFHFGVEHILFGVDHLLFVLALLLLVKGWKRLVETITAFTIAHSVTLALAALGVIHVPAPPVEAIIALSIAFVAAEIIRSRRGRPGLAERFPWLVAGAFGLLHGLGFASALSEIGLPQSEIPISLLFFNLGVEFGQLLFVAAAALLIVAAKRVPVRRPRGAELLLPYAIGAVAMFWVLERVSAF